MAHTQKRLTVEFCTQASSRLIGLVIFLAGLASAMGTVTVTPPSSTTAPVVFRFSTAVDVASGVQTVFYNTTTYTPYTPVLSWSQGDTVLTCTPTTPWPGADAVTYMIIGDDVDAFPVYETGSFTVGSTSGGGSGTNRITTFNLGITHAYNQTSTGTPTLDPDAPFIFGNLVLLASNRTAISVTLTNPAGLGTALQHNSFAPEQYYFTYSTTDSNALNNSFPAGKYTNTIFATASNQSVILVLTNASAQPPVPHVTNYTAAQSVNPAQAFQLGWDTFTGGTANDFIHFNIQNVFNSPGYTEAGMLRGTSNSIVIPAGTLKSGSNYIASLGFYRMIFVTNNSGYAANAYRSTITEFTLRTTGSQTSAALLTNGLWSGGKYSFDVVATAGQNVTVECSTNLPGQWSTVLVTNSTVSRFRITDAQSSGKPYRFYRARTGP